MHKRAVEHMLEAELDAHLDNEKHENQNVFTYLGLILIDNNINYEISTGKKVSILNLKKYIKDNPSKLVFEELTQIFELLYYISPTSNSTYNYNTVPLIVAFSDYLKIFWRDYGSAQGIFNTYRKILDMRNCAAHTYSDSIID